MIRLLVSETEMLMKFWPKGEEVTRDGEDNSEEFYELYSSSNVTVISH